MMLLKFKTSDNEGGEAIGIARVREVPTIDSVIVGVVGNLEDKYTVYEIISATEIEAKIIRSQDSNWNPTAQFKHPLKRGFSIQIPYSSTISACVEKGGKIEKARDIKELCDYINRFGTKSQKAFIAAEFKEFL